MAGHDTLDDRLRRLFAARARQPMPDSLGERLSRVGAGDARLSVWHARWMQFAVTAAVVAIVATAVSLGHLALSERGRGASSSPPAVTNPTTSPSTPSATPPSSATATPQSGSQSEAAACPRGLVFMDQQHGWLVEPTGSETTAVFATSNGGTTWRSQLSLASLTVQLDFVNASDGWVLGQATSSGSGATQRFLRTTDGGATWVSVTPPDQPLACVDFVSSTLGYAVTQSGLLLSTADGGSTWTTVRVGDGIATATLCFESRDQGWVVAGSSQSGGEGIYLTEDGGGSWRRQYSAPWLRGDGIGCSGPTVWVKVALGAGAGSSFYEYVRTTDGGAHWTPAPSPTPLGQEFVDMGGPFQVVDAATVEIAGHGINGPLFETAANNQPGSPSAISVPSGLSSLAGVDGLSFINAQDGWILLGGPEVTTGTSSDRQPTPLRLAVDRPGGDHPAFLAGGCGPFIDYVYVTTDGGHSWHPLAHLTYTIPISLCTGPTAS